MPRLYHHKSRTGCARCRARRVKCDENRPKCTSCTRHDMDCVYDRQPQGLPRPTPRPSEVSPSTSNENDSGELQWTETRERRLLELRLLHIFTVHIVPTLPASYEPSHLKAWSVDVPRLALKHEPLLNAIFSISLLFISCNSDQELPCPPEELRLARARYFQATLEEHRNDLNSMDAETADAVAFSGILIMFDGFARLRERRPQLNGAYDPPTEWLKLCKGLQHVIGRGLRLTAQRPNSIIGSLPDSASPLFAASYVHTEANRARFSHLLERYGADMIHDAAEEEAYTAAIVYLGSIANAIDAGEVPLRVARRVVINNIILTDTFLALLDRMEPRALVVLAHYFALAASSSWVWWIGDSPVNEVEGIEAYLGAEWEDLMAWPSQVLRERRRTYIMSTLS